MRNPAGGKTSRDDLLNQLIRQPRKSNWTKALAEHPELLNSETVTHLSDAVRERAKVDTTDVMPLAELAMMVAKRIRDKSAQARSLRAMGNALHVSGQNATSAIHHEKARAMFARLGDRTETARTLSASIQPLILIGQYKRALANAQRARELFSALHDHLRSARLDLNTGNIFHRRDEFAKALQWYRRAHARLARYENQDPEAVAVALHNIAMCLVSLNDFHGALAAHQEARAFAQNHGMQVLVGQADYNIAALYHFRGQYTHAVNLLLATRETCTKNHDYYHVALCQLDLSDIYLELNLSQPAEEMAREASDGFEKLGMRYEAGKSLVNLALAVARQNQPAAARKMLIKARRQFVAEKNVVWPFLMDLYRAAMLVEEGHHREAQTLGLAACRFFKTAGIPNNLVLAGFCCLGPTRFQENRARRPDNAPWPSPS
jgi:tetratricopeptide (TPR) repeat protein